MKNGVFWGVTQRSVRWLLVTASVVPSSPILVTLMKETLSSSATSVLTRATCRNTPEDTILHSHGRENLISYNRVFWTQYLHFTPIYFHHLTIIITTTEFTVIKTHNAAKPLRELQKSQDWDQW
jgi:hypothetical protein